MGRYKFEYNFNFAEAMKFFLTQIDKCIDRHDEDFKADKTVEFKMRCWSYPYNMNMISMIKETFDIRGYKIVLASFITNTNDSKKSYEYTFKISKKITS